MDISPLDGTITTPQWSKLWSKKGINLSKPQTFLSVLWGLLDFAELRDERKTKPYLKKLPVRLEFMTGDNRKCQEVLEKKTTVVRESRGDRELSP